MILSHYTDGMSTDVNMLRIHHQNQLRIFQYWNDIVQLYLNKPVQYCNLCGPEMIIGYDDAFITVTMSSDLYQNRELSDLCNFGSGIYDYSDTIQSNDGIRYAIDIRTRDALDNSTRRILSIRTSLHYNELPSFIKHHISEHMRHKTYKKLMDMYKGVSTENMITVLDCLKKPVRYYSIISSDVGSMMGHQQSFSSTYEDRHSDFHSVFESLYGDDIMPKLGAGIDDYRALIFNFQLLGIPEEEIINTLSYVSLFYDGVLMRSTPSITLDRPNIFNKDI